MNPHLISILFLLGAVVLPLSYIALCISMLRHRVWWFTYIAYFFLFGSLGGWCLTMQFPNGPILLIGFYSLYSVGALACLSASLVLSFRKNRSRFDLAAMVGGYGYLAVLALVFMATAFTSL